MLHVCSYIVALCYSFTDILSLCATVLPVRCHSVLKFYRYIVTLYYSFTGILSLYATVLKVDCHSGLQFYRNIVTLSYSFTGFLSLCATVLQVFCHSVLQFYRHIVGLFYSVTLSRSISGTLSLRATSLLSQFLQVLIIITQSSSSTVISLLSVAVPHVYRYCCSCRLQFYKYTVLLI